MSVVLLWVRKTSSTIFVVVVLMIFFPSAYIWFVHLQVRFVVVDFTDDDLDGGLSRISQRTADIHVGILINNVGISYPYARFFHELDEKLTKNLLRVNIEVTTRMIQLFLPSMLKHKRGAIINVGSGAGSVLPSDPLYTLYAATKAYVHHPSPRLKHQSRTYGHMACRLIHLQKGDFTYKLLYICICADCWWWFLIHQTLYVLFCVMEFSWYFMWTGLLTNCQGRSMWSTSTVGLMSSAKYFSLYSFFLFFCRTSCFFFFSIRFLTLPT